MDRSVNPCDPVEQQRRADYLEALYHLYGRDSPNVAHHGCFTGLLEQRKRTLLLRDRAEVLGRVSEDRRVPAKGRR